MSLVVEPKWSDSNHAALLKLYLSSFFIGCFGSTRAIPLKMALQASPEHPTREPVSHCRQLQYSLRVLVETAVIFSYAMGSCSGLWGCEVELWRVKSDGWSHQASCSTYCFFARYGELSHYTYVERTYAERKYVKYKVFYLTYRRATECISIIRPHDIVQMRATTFIVSTRD